MNEMNDTLMKTIREGSLTKDIFLIRINDLIETMLIRQDPYERANFFTNLMTAARYFDLEKLVEKAAQEKADEWNEPELWELPESFENLKKTLPFPMHNLPPLLRDYLQAVSDYVQVVPEMAILPMLSVLSLCVQGKAVIMKPDDNEYIQPLNIYTITIASPGERKSGSLKAFMKPVNDFQQRYNKIHALEIENYKTEREYLEIKKMRAINGNNADLQTAKDITRQIADLEEKHELVLNVSDATPEALAWELHLHNERMGIIDDEGGIFDILSGLYTNKTSNFELFTHTYDCSSYSISRRTKDNINLINPLLTMGLMTQPEHFEKTIKNQAFLSRGLIQRFLFSFPESRAGYLKMNSPSIPPQLRKQYGDLINRLLRMPSPPEPPVIQCNKEAELLFSDYFDHMQKEIRESEMCNPLKEWASKQFARALRIAGILHLCEHEPAERLTGQTAMNAIGIATWSESHAFNALSDSASEPTEIKNAKYILKKLKASDDDMISKTKLFRLCQTLKKADEFKEPLEILEDMSCIKIETIRNGERGKPKERIKINPLIKNL